MGLKGANTWNRTGCMHKAPWSWHKKKQQLNEASGCIWVYLRGAQAQLPAEDEKLALGERVLY